VSSSFHERGDLGAIMRIFAVLLTILSLNAMAYTSLSDWTVCQGEVCKEVKAGDDLYLRHGFKNEAATYSTQFDKSQLSCFSKNDCWLFLGSVGDSAVVRLNSEIIGKFEGFIHHQSLKLSVPSSLIQDGNEIEIEISDLNQTRFGLRSPEVGIGISKEVTKLTNKDWLLRTGSTLLSAFTLFVLLLGMIATYGIYKNRKILPLIGLTGIGLLYLISFSEIPRAYLDPVFMSGPVHFTLRLGVELAVVLVALSFYTPHSKINFLKKLPTAYVFAILPMVLGGILGHKDYSFYKTVMLVVAPLVIGGGLTLTILSYFYYDRAERLATLPIFLSLLLFQIYDLIVFWELMPGTFTIKWYLPFLTIAFSWIYFRRRINEVRSLKIEAIIGDQIRKFSHDLAAPIQSLKSVLMTNSAELNPIALKAIESINEITASVLGRTETDSLKCESSDNLNIILADIADQLKERVCINFQLSPEFDWYTVEAVSFKRIFINLFSNSIKARASRIEVTGRLQKSTLVVSVYDNGNGIPMELQPYLFEKGITSDKSSGCGLGLNYVKEKLNEMGFDISLDQTSSSGTTFKIMLPLNEIILIDDNQIVKDSWVTLGASVGVHVHCYESEDPVLSQIRQKRNIPVFVDYNLGLRSGLEAAQKIKAAGFKIVALATGETVQIDPRIAQVSKKFPYNNIPKASS
jgi:signal transduction histidine kinase/CheY-like chemotaxis protein